MVDSVEREVIVALVSPLIVVTRWLLSRSVVQLCSTLKAGARGGVAILI